MPRQKGKKNLNRVDDSFFNQYRVEVSLEEKQNLERLVRKANRQRKRQVDEWLDRPFKPYGLDQGLKNRDRTQFAKDSSNVTSDFIITKKTASLQRFKTREEFDNYVDYLERATSKGYMEERTALYKENYITALRNAFHSDADYLIERIERLDLKTYRKLVEEDDVREIGYVYDGKQAEGLLEEISESWESALDEMD